MQILSLLAVLVLITITTAAPLLVHPATAVVKSTQSGGNFAYSTYEGHPYPPPSSHLVHHVPVAASVVSYHQTPLLTGAPFYAAQYTPTYHQYPFVPQQYPVVGGGGGGLFGQYPVFAGGAPVYNPTLVGVPPAGFAPVAPVAPTEDTEDTVTVGADDGGAVPLDDASSGLGNGSAGDSAVVDEDTVAIDSA